MECFRCHAKRMDGEGGGGMMGGMMGGGMGGGGFQHKKGDWVCKHCQNDNFARRLTCHRCEAPRPTSRFYWLCPNQDCKFDNLGVRTTCMRCDTPNPADPMEYARPGDWKVGLLGRGEGGGCWWFSDLLCAISLPFSLSLTSPSLPDLT